MLRLLTQFKLYRVPSTGSVWLSPVPTLMPWLVMSAEPCVKSFGTDLDDEREKADESCGRNAERASATL